MVKKQQGFSLIELLVVLAILVAVAGIGTFAYELAHKSGRKELSQVDFVSLQNAIQQFSEDTGITPIINASATGCGVRRSSADFDFLFTQNSCSNWNPGLRTGWKGPYLLAPKKQEVTDGTETYPAIHNGMGGTYQTSVSLPEGQTISYTEASVVSAPIIYFSSLDIAQPFIGSTGWDGVFDVDITSVTCANGFSDDLLCL
jgi:prepilin-type N-terminal cleavage/methylation domain-containing protein